MDLGQSFDHRTYLGSPKSPSLLPRMPKCNCQRWISNHRARVFTISLLEESVFLGLFITPDPSVGITLYFGGRVIKIAGRNLNAEVRPNVTLVQALLRHRVPWIQEADGPTMLEAGRNVTVIEEITC